MIPTLVSRTAQLIRILVHHPSRKALLPSPATSPRSSEDIDETYILPLSTPRSSGFDVIFVPPQRFRLASSVHGPLVLVLILFPLTTGLVLSTLSTLPITFAWPRTLQDLAQLGRELGGYAQSGALPTAHILAVLGLSATWKHAWSVPGAVLWNVLAGALFHPFLATLLMTSLTALGSVVATLLAAPLAPLLGRFFPRPIELTRTLLEGSNSGSSSPPSSSAPAWVRLAILRLSGVVPWSGLNVACGVADIRLRDCALGAFIGTLPWTAVTCQIGDILQTVAADGSGDETRTIASLLATPQIVVELVFLTVLSLAPILGRKRLSRLVSPAPSDTVQPSLAQPSPVLPSTPTSSTLSEFTSWSPTSTVVSFDEEKDTDIERIELMMQGKELVVARSPRRDSKRSKWPSVSWTLPKPTISKLRLPFASTTTS